MADAELKPWQHGYPLDSLKQAAALFKEQHGPHVYGAFGLAKEREVAEALHSGLWLSTGANGQNDAALIYRTLAHGSTHETYYNRAVQIGAGETIIGTFACRTGAAGMLLLETLTRTLHDQSPGSMFPVEPIIWAEIFEEDSNAKWALIGAGFQYVDSKVLAGSEIKGLYVRGRIVTGPSEPAEVATLSILERNFLTPGELEDITAELSSANWAQHYSNYNKKDSWTAFAVKGYDVNDPLFIIKPDEMSRKWKAENAERLRAHCAYTLAAAHFPATLRLLDRIPGAKDRVRFMRLTKGGGELSRHADITNRNAGLADGRLARLHIPIITNPNVVMTQWNSRGKKVQGNFPVGALCYLDQRQPHTVVNQGETDRVHLVIDTASSEIVRSLVAVGAL